MAEAGAKTSKGRIKITLACSQCLSRNCKTTRARDSATALQLNKFCPTCKRHTLHKETK